MWVKQCSFNTTYKNADVGDGLWHYFYPHYSSYLDFFVLQLLRVWPTRFQIHRCKRQLTVNHEHPEAGWAGCVCTTSLVGGDLPLWKIWKSGGIIIPNIWKIKIVPNHQPVSHWWIYIYIYYIYVFIYWFIHLFIYLFIYCFYLFNYLLICLFIYLLLVIIVNSQAIDEYEHVNIIPIWMRRFRNFHVLSTIFQDFRMTIFFYSVDYHLIRKLFVAPWLLIWYGKWILI